MARDVFYVIIILGLVAFSILLLPTRGGLFVIIILGLVLIFIWLFKIMSGVKIGILGTKGSGKTRLYRFLEGKPYEEKQTPEEEYKGFKYIKKDGTSVRIAKGVDIGGGKDYRRRHMHKFLEEKDSIIYIINLEEFLNNENMRRDVKDDIEYIYSHKEENMHVCTLLSHIDKFVGQKCQNEALETFKKYMENKKYSNLIFANYAVVNIEDEEQLKNIENKLFP